MQAIQVLVLITNSILGIYRAPLAVCFKDFYTLKEVVLIFLIILKNHFIFFSSPSLLIYYQIVLKVTDPEALKKLQPTVTVRPSCHR